MLFSFKGTGHTTLKRLKKRIQTVKKQFSYKISCYFCAQKPALHTRKQDIQNNNKGINLWQCRPAFYNFTAR